MKILTGWAYTLASRAGVSAVTLRRWQRTNRRPRWATILLALLDGELAAIDAAFCGWTIRDGQLWSPESQGFTPGMVRAGPLHEEAARSYRAQLADVTATAESGADRRRRIDALALLKNAFRAASSALEVLAEDLTAPERARLFERLDSTHAQRSRARTDAENYAEWAAELRQRKRL